MTDRRTDRRTGGGFCVAFSAVTTSINLTDRQGAVVCLTPGYALLTLTLEQPWPWSRVSKRSSFKAAHTAIWRSSAARQMMLHCSRGIYYTFNITNDSDKRRSETHLAQYKPIGVRVDSVFHSVSCIYAIFLFTIMAVLSLAIRLQCGKLAHADMVASQQ